MNNTEETLDFEQKHKEDLQRLRACLKNKNCTKRMFYFPFS